jgi:hypothetical protein
MTTSEPDTSRESAEVQERRAKYVERGQKIQAGIDKVAEKQGKAKKAAPEKSAAK